MCNMSPYPSKMQLKSRFSLKTNDLFKDIDGWVEC